MNRQYRHNVRLASGMLVTDLMKERRVAEALADAERAFVFEIDRMFGRTGMYMLELDDTFSPRIRSLCEDLVEEGARAAESRRLDRDLADTNARTGAMLRAILTPTTSAKDTALLVAAASAGADVDTLAKHLRAHEPPETLSPGQEDALRNETADEAKLRAWVDAQPRCKSCEDPASNLGEDPSDQIDPETGICGMCERRMAVEANDPAWKDETDIHDKNDKNGEE